MKAIQLLFWVGVIGAIPTAVEAISTSVINRAGGNNVKTVPQDSQIQNLPADLTATKAPDGTYRYGTRDPQLPLENPPKKGKLISQDPLVFEAPSPIYNAAFTDGSLAKSTTLSVTGGNGDGAVTFSVVSGGCTMDGVTIRSPSTNFDTTTTCVVKATKAASGQYNTAVVTGNVTVYGFYLFHRIGVPSQVVPCSQPTGSCTRASVTVISCRSDGDSCMTGAGGYGTSNLSLTGSNCAGSYNSSTGAVSDWTLWIYLLGSTTFPHESCVISATVKGKILTTKTPVRNLNNFPNIGSITYLPGGTKFAPN